jgi:hypothetical protein
MSSVSLLLYFVAQMPSVALLLCFIGLQTFAAVC